MPNLPKIMLALLLLAVLLIQHGEGRANELALEGYVQMDLRVFPGPRSYAGQNKSVLSPSLALAPELIFESSSGDDRFTFKPYLRLDTHDSERTHIDIREAIWLRQGDGWDIQVGLGKVFWGVTESNHLVDIINQTDGVEDIDSEDKLGQPMLNYNVEGDFGALGLFVLPGFRERTFPGSQARLRGGMPFVTGEATYDSSAKELNVDFAVRWSRVYGDVDVGLSHFHGTSREARFYLVNQGGRTILKPHYDLIDQTGLDVQLTSGAWLWKLEAITRSGHGDRFFAGVGGLEYTFYQIAGAADLGLIAEISEDGRDKSRAPVTLNDNDVFLGARLALNDDKDTSALAGIIVDRLTKETLMSFEAERRLTDNWKFEFEARVTTATPPDGATHGIRHDDFFMVRLVRFF
jgi:hypothetical protein